MVIALNFPMKELNHVLKNNAKPLTLLLQLMASTFSLKLEFPKAGMINNEIFLEPKVNVNGHQIGRMLLREGVNPLSKWLLKP